MSDSKTPVRGISRRSFLKTSAVVAGAATVSGGGALTALAADSAGDGAAEHEVITVCGCNCQGNCSLITTVREGRVVNVRSNDDIPYPAYERVCMRGFSHPQRLYDFSRITYPMKRKTWTMEEPHVENRGSDEWERISWDEALDLCAAEVKRIADTYGPMAINYAGIPFYNAPVAQTLLPALGGYTWHLGFTSYGSWCSEPDAIGIDNTAGEPGTMGTNDRLSMLESDLIVLHGNNPVHAAAARLRCISCAPMRRESPSSSSARTTARRPPWWRPAGFPCAPRRTRPSSRR